MVGLSDIPCVGVAADKFSKVIVEAGIRGLRYLLCYKSIVNNLNSEIENVKIQEVRVERKVAAARRDGKTVEDHVTKWQEEVVKIKTLCDQLSRQRTSFTCFKVVHFPNPVSRFRLGRKATYQSKNVAQLTVSGREFLANEIAYLPAVENVPTSKTTYHRFVSRQEAYGKLWEKLVNEDGDSVLGIYGMPGVGKTRMMEEAWKDAMEKKIFDKVVLVNVGGEKFDVISLQDKLAVSLGCHLESNDETRRASQLKHSLMNEGRSKTLVILDDVWDVVHLNNVGIPFGDGSSKGCKILLTSRKQNVCLLNNCADPIEIRILTDGEAWAMFRYTVGTSKIQSLQDPSLAMKVCKECGALPLLVDAVGQALMVLTEDIWLDALYQLENCKFDEIDGIDPKVYTCIQFSFDKLAEGEKTCLLLCSMFPEDADIDIKMLFDLATGSELLDSRRNIRGLVEILISSSLLLQGEYLDTVKVHDIIRDVARSVAARDTKYAFLSVRCRSSLPDNHEYRTTRLLHLDLEGSNVRFPDDHAYTKVHTLWMQSDNQSQQLSTGFFNAFKNLKVLLLKGMCLSEQQIYIHALKKLRVLILDRCGISQTFLTSISRSLETLCIWNCDLPCPLDLPKLENLRKLEFLSPIKIEVVANAISNLSSLAELKSPSGFKIRDAVDGHIKIELIYSELSQLRHLRNLVISFDNSNYYPDKDTFPTLLEFNISVGYQMSHFPRGSKKVIMLDTSSVESEWMGLVERAEEVKLRMVSGLPNGFSDSDMRVTFQNLRELTLNTCKDMEHVASWNGVNQRLACFTNLTIVHIHDCSRMKFVFSSSVAKCLLQMQTLQVAYCDAIEEIVRVDASTDHGDELICFPKLEDLHLWNLPSLTSFYTNKVAYPFLERLEHSAFSQLKFLNVQECDKLENVIPVTMLHRFEKLEQMDIDRCKSLKTVFQHLLRANLDKINNESIVFPAVKELTLKSLPELKSLWSYDYVEVNPKRQSYFIPKLTFPNVVRFEIKYVKSEEDIVLGSDDHSSSKLTSLEVFKYLDSDSSGELRTNNQVQLLPPQWKLQLQNLETLSLQNSYWPGNSMFTGRLTFKRLKELEVEYCGVSALFTTSVFRSLQQLVKLTVSNCPLLEKIVEDEDDANGTNEKTPVSLLQLESVSLGDLPNLQSIGISACYMPALYKVRVDRCGLITTLFTTSAFKDLKLLQELQVSDCPLLEEIVEDEMDNETPETSEKMISLPLLEIIQLTKLPRLRAFSRSSTFTFNMPALGTVYLSKCPCMDKFTSLPIKAPSIFINSTFDSGKVVSDINNYLRTEHKNTKDGTSD